MKLLMSFLMLISFNLFANEQMDINPQSLLQDHHGECKGLVITPVQKEQIRRLINANKEEAAVLKRRAKRAMRNHVRTVANPSSVKEDALQTMRRVKRTVRPLFKMKSEMMMTVLYDILVGEQRQKLVKCKMQERRKQRKSKPVPSQPQS